MKALLFYPCGAPLYRTLKLELKLELDGTPIIIMIVIQHSYLSTWLSWLSWHSKRYRELRSINNDITRTARAVKVQTARKGEPYEQCEKPSDAVTVAKRVNGLLWLAFRT